MNGTRDIYDIFFSQKFHDCLVRKIENAPGTVPKILYLSAAYEYQHLYIAHKVGLCSNVPISPIKTIAEDSGMTRADKCCTVKRALRSSFNV